MMVSMTLVTAPILAQEEQLQAPRRGPSTSLRTNSGQENGRIIVGTEQDYPPYSFLDEKGEPTGFNVELTRAIAEAAGLDVEIDYRPWAEIREDLESGKINAISGMYYSQERDELVDFSPPYAVVHHAIFAREDAPEIESEEELRGKDLIVMQGDIMHDYVIENGLSERPVVVEDQAEALRLLASGQHDYALIAKLPGLYWVRELRLSNVVIVGPSLRPSRYCYAVKEGDSELLFRLSEGLAIVKETGQYREIYDKWLGMLEPQRVPTGATLKYVAFVLLPYARASDRHGPLVLVPAETSRSENRGTGKGNHRAGAGGGGAAAAHRRSRIALRGRPTTWPDSRHQHHL